MLRWQQLLGLDSVWFLLEMVVNQSGFKANFAIPYLCDPE